MRRKSVMNVPGRMSRAFLASLLPIFVALSFLSAGAHAEEEELKLVPLAEADNIANSGLLQGVVNRFEDAGLGVPYPVYLVDTEEVNAWADGRKVDA